jgi:hypothetical protein
MSKKLLICAILMVMFLTGYCQVNKKIREYDRTFQFSIFPGISTNGISSGSYYNSFSLNLFGGLSAGNRILEIGLLTNNNLKTTTGIQLAGLANITGANAFVNLSLSEERAMINSEDFEVNRKGIQMAGLLNYVLNNASGIQIAGGLNVVGNNFRGFQLAGVGNSSGQTTVGLQLAGIYNLSKESVGGFQISAIFNYTDAQLSGLQLGLINKAAIIKGGKSTPPTLARGLQLGLINSSKAMDGWQIGLINFGGDARGKQIGLINFFSKYPSKEQTRMGTPIGLLNFGSKGSYIKISFNELFLTNLEYTTGNCLNCTWIIGSEMPYHDTNQIFNQNALILGFDPIEDTWGFGYGFQKLLYNKFSTRPHELNRKRIITYGIKLIHMNRDMSFDKTFNLLTKLNLEYAKRWKFLYVYAGVSLNYFIYDGADENSDVYKIRSVKISTGNVGSSKSEIWPGYSAGIQYNL